MPDMTPIGNTFNTPNPMTGINTLSGIVGLKQQQQALQTGQYNQATAQAESEQAQQKNRELQKVSALMQSVHNGGYRKADGTLDRQKFADDITTVAPVYGQGQASSILSQANEIVSNQKAKQDLTDSARASLGTTLTALAKDPNTRRDDVVDAYSRWLQDHKDDPAAFRVGVAQAAMLPQNDADPKFRDILGKYAATLTGQPTTAPTTVDTGGAIQPGQVSNVTGAITPTGAPIQKTLTPTEQLGYKAAATNVGPDAQRFSDISNDNQRAQSMVSLSQQVGHLAEQVRTGKLSKEWTDRLAVLNQDSPGITARQMLGKYAAQLKTMAESGASTDAERHTVEAGLPNPDTMDPSAVKEAAQYIGGIGAMRKARSDVASAYVNKNGTNGVRAVDDQFMQHADPFVFMYRNLSAGQERQQFLLKKFGDGKQITDKAGLQKFLDQQNVVKHYGG